MSKKTPDVIVKKASSATECCCCKKPVGPEVKVYPVQTTADDGSEPEVWCPVCFVFKRAGLEPGRREAAAPVFCMNCQHETLTLDGTCANCKARGRALRILAPASAL